MVKNALHRREHKERSQPLDREKYGILEKKKDYLERARNYHHKREIIERLRSKAADRNKDEFYFSMKNEKTNRGVHVKYRKNASLTTDIAVVLKAQDANYIRTMRKANLRRISALKAQLAMLADLTAGEKMQDGDESILRKAGLLHSGEGNRPGHIVFVDDEEAAWKYEYPAPAATSSTADANGDAEEDVDLGWVKPSSSKAKGKQKQAEPSDEESSDDGGDGGDEADEDGTPADTDRRTSAAKKSRSKLIKELAARLERDKHLRYAEQELDMQRMSMAGKGARKKITDKEQVFTGGDDEEEFSFRRKGRMPVVELGNEVYKPKVMKWRTERKR